MKKTISILLPVLFLTTGVVRADFVRGFDAYNKGDYETALREFRVVAEQGHAGAQTNLGVMYAKGKGVPENDQEAVRWFRKAAEQGHHAGAQYNLGLRYAVGQGVPENNLQAYKWVSLSATQGYKDAKGVLKIVRERMSPSQIAEAQALAAEWWEKHNQ